MSSCTALIDVLEVLSCGDGIDGTVGDDDGDAPGEDVVFAGIITDGGEAFISTNRSVLENGLWICEVDEDPAVGVDDVVGGRDGAPDLVAVTGTGAFARNGVKLDPTCVLEGEEELVLFEDPIREPIATKGFEGTFVEVWDDEEVDVTTHLCELQ